MGRRLGGFMAVAAVAAIVSALVAGGTAIYSGVKSSEATEAAGAEAKKMYEYEQAEGVKARKQAVLERREQAKTQKEQLGQQWQQYMDSKKNYREQMNKASLSAAGNVLNDAMSRNDAFKQKILNYYK